MPQVTQQFESAMDLCLEILIVEKNGVLPDEEELAAFFSERFGDLLESNRVALIEIGLEEELRAYCRAKGDPQ